MTESSGPPDPSWMRALPSAVALSTVGIRKLTILQSKKRRIRQRGLPSDFSDARSADSPWLFFTATEHGEINVRVCLPSEIRRYENQSEVSARNSLEFVCLDRRDSPNTLIA